MFKKACAMFLSIILIFSLASCNGIDIRFGKSGDTKKQENKNIKINFEGNDVYYIIEDIKGFNDETRDSEAIKKSFSKIPKTEITSLTAMGDLPIKVEFTGKNIPKTVKVQKYFLENDPTLATYQPVELDLEEIEVENNKVSFSWIPPSRSVASTGGVAFYYGYEMVYTENGVEKALYFALRITKAIIGG